MISSGEKRAEYREIKPYWDKRLVGKRYDVVKFRNGYAPTSPTMTVELLEISTGIGRPEWGGTGEAVYVLSLGEVLGK